MKRPTIEMLYPDGYIIRKQVNNEVVDYMVLGGKVLRFNRGMKYLANLLFTERIRNEELELENKKLERHIKAAKKALKLEEARS